MTERSYHGATSRSSDTLKCQCMHYSQAVDKEGKKEMFLFNNILNIFY